MNIQSALMPALADRGDGAGAGAGRGWKWIRCDGAQSMGMQINADGSTPTTVTNPDGTPTPSTGPSPSNPPQSLSDTPPASGPQPLPEIPPHRARNHCQIGTAIHVEADGMTWHPLP